MPTDDNTLPTPLRKEDAPPYDSSMLPSLAPDNMYRARDIGVYHALEAPGPCDAHEHAEAQIMITFPRASYRAEWHTETGTKRQQQFTGAGVNILPSGQTHGFDWRTEDRLLSFYLTPEFLAGLSQEMGQPDCREVRTQWGARDPLIEQMARALWREFQRDAAPSRLYIESAATALAAHILRGQNTDLRPSSQDRGGLAPRKLRHTLDYIHAHFHQDITLQAMACEAGLERHHFAHAFKQSTGFAPYEFVLRCRVERAAHLLITTRLPVAHIAHAVGFKDPGQFSRHFKRIVGVTPRARRESSF